MFFRREKVKQKTFQDRLQDARQAGFTVTNEGSGAVRISRGSCAATLVDRGAEPPQLGKSGLLSGDEIAILVDGGYQKFFRTPSGKRLPAEAVQLKLLHAFTEDLMEALDLKSLYNTSLGTTCGAHLYDRVKDRDRGVPVRPWEQ